MKLLPSASYSRAPWARSTKSGEPPTAFHARTGELTAPGMIALARINRSFDLFTGIIDYSLYSGSDRVFWSPACTSNDPRQRIASLRQGYDSWLPEPIKRTSQIHRPVKDS